ncbi:MAG: TetR/AcrR family transcriptional regulator C-terminal domain-containing protein [Acidimicrobiia bacterium]|nr:TetR/AcrR family transcriptional regulator C-terminal domain-containing protein [Acidimicrobiia bacterium]
MTTGVVSEKNVAVAAVFVLLEQRLSDLTASGVEDEEAVRLYYDLLAYTLGFVAWELPRARALTRREYSRRWRSAVEVLDAGEYPTVRRLVGVLTTVASDQQFEDGLRRIIGSSA